MRNYFSHVESFRIFTNVSLVQRKSDESENRKIVLRHSHQVGKMGSRIKNNVASLFFKLRRAYLRTHLGIGQTNLKYTILAGQILTLMQTDSYLAVSSFAAREIFVAFVLKVSCLNKSLEVRRISVDERSEVAL